MELRIVVDGPTWPGVLPLDQTYWYMFSSDNDHAFYGAKAATFSDRALAGPFTAEEMLEVMEWAMKKGVPSRII